MRGDVHLIALSDLELKVCLLARGHLVQRRQFNLDRSRHFAARRAVLSRAEQPRDARQARHEHALTFGRELVVPIADVAVSRGVEPRGSLTHEHRDGNPTHRGEHVDHAIHHVHNARESTDIDALERLAVRVEQESLRDGARLIHEGETA